MNKQILPLSVIALICWLFYLNNRTPDNKLPVREKQTDFRTYDINDAENDVIDCIAYAEGFSSKPYYCGTWSVGYGTTRYADGSEVTQYSRSITRAEARQCLVSHLRKHVFPTVRRNIRRSLTYGEFIGCCMFICNVGEGNFENSSFLRALNNHSPSFVCAEKMALYNKVRGATSSGLQKRRWLEGAVFCGHISPDDIRHRQNNDIYNYNVSFLYKNGQPDFTPNVVRTFLKNEEI